VGASRLVRPHIRFISVEEPDAERTAKRTPGTHGLGAPNDLLISSARLIAVKADVQRSDVSLLEPPQDVLVVRRE
jgi:hypothetical protein